MPFSMEDFLSRAKVPDLYAAAHKGLAGAGRQALPVRTERQDVGDIAPREDARRLAGPRLPDGDFDVLVASLLEHPLPVRARQPRPIGTEGRPLAANASPLDDERLRLRGGVPDLDRFVEAARSKPPAIWTERQTDRLVRVPQDQEFVAGD